jgi:GDPmannose 4,6-dehydratase
LFNTERVDHIYQDPHVDIRKFFLHYGDLTDSSNLTRIIQETQPDEIYNLGAQSHVAVSFESPEYTADVDGMGTLRILEAIRILGLEKKTRFYQASTSELYGLTMTKNQNEKTVFYPQSPYAISKLYAYWITKHYREAYKIYACNGILFNHESPRRGETFVTRKITIGLAKIVLGIEKKLELGNLESLRDWGHAKDYAEMQWLMLQRKNPTDYVISTGRQYSVKKFIEMCLQYMGIKIYWKGKGPNEMGVIKEFDKNKDYKLKKGQIIIKVNKKYFRPSDVENLLGDSSKARKELKWQNKYSIKDLISEMVDHDIYIAKNELRNEY